MLKYIIIIGLILSIGLISNNVVAKENIIPDEAIRLRVIAHSNLPYDQYIKTMVRKELQVKVYDLLDNINNIDEASAIINNNLAVLDNTIHDVFVRENYHQKYNIVYGNNYFPAKEYKDITYDEGYYESLLVTLGQGKGDNWWCVLFPPLCLIEAEEASDVEYKFFIQEIIDRFLKK